MRKNWKKIVSLLVAASMVMSMNVATFAEEIHDEVVEEVVAADEVVLSDNDVSDNDLSDNSASENTTITVSCETIKVGDYEVKISYNKVVGFTGKKVNADTIKATATVSGGDLKNVAANVKVKVGKSDAAKGKGLGKVEVKVVGLTAADKTNKKAVAAVSKLVKKAPATLEVTVAALSLSKNDVLSGNKAKNKDIKGMFKLTNGTVSPNYVVNLKYNDKKPEKSKVTLAYATVKKTKKGYKLIVKFSNLKNGKNGVKYTVKDGVATFDKDSAVVGTLSK